MTRILFTGGGGAGNEAIYRLWKDDYDLFFADAQSESIAPTIPRNRRFSIPMADHQSFVESLVVLCRETEIDVLIPGVDEELPHMSAIAALASNLRILVPRAEFISSTIDKLETARVIAKASLDAPKTAALGAEGISAMEFPCIAKPRYGRGSRGLKILASSKEAIYFSEYCSVSGEEYVVQELLKGQEYTVMLAANEQGGLSAIVPVKVDVKQGITIRGTVVEDDDVVGYCERVHQGLSGSACYNIQLIKTNTGRIAAFEINPRVSTTFCLGLAAGIDPVDIFLSDKPVRSLIPFRTGINLRRHYKNELCDTMDLTKPLKHSPSLTFENFPFYVGVRDAEEESQLPSHLPFSLFVDSMTATVRAMSTGSANAAVELAYELGSMLSTPLGQGPLANDRMTEFIAGLEAAFGHGMVGRRFLEVGCGEGILLNELKKRGAQVSGIEIGPQSEAASRFGIEVISEPLTPDLFTEPFDCILSYGTLEHIVELEDFLQSCRSSLVDGGLMFHSVPNMESTYAQLAVDDLCHEHVTYFTPSSARRLFEARGFINAQAKATKAGNELHVWGHHDPAASLYWPGNNAKFFISEERALQSFARDVNARLKYGQHLIRAMLERGESVGFYAGGFIFADLGGFGDRILYYDSDPEKHGKVWLQGLPPIRSPADLVADPPDHVVICREHYAAAIRQSLVDDLNIAKSVRLHDLTTLCTQDAR